MQTIDVVVETEIFESTRCRQLESIFDVPSQEKSILKWKGEIPIDEFDWNVGLIVGPSGSGKSTIARHLFGKRVDHEPKWGAKSVIDDFAKRLSVADISKALSSVGFNTIPAWLRPYRVLSTGEKFRVSIARRLLEHDSPVVVDEFTSVVDRQVAKIASHAVQKYVRKLESQFVAVSCHHDVIEWLQPDWVFEPATMKFSRRRLQQRPKIECVISPIAYSGWEMFASYHYLSAKLHKSARCFGLFVKDELVAFCGVLHRPHPTRKNIKGVSRLVTLPDWQGCGLAFVLVEAVGSIYNGVNQDLRMYPAHPQLIRSFDRSCVWVMTKRPGLINNPKNKSGGLRMLGGRPCAVFEYVGPKLSRSESDRVLSYWVK